MKKGVDCRGNEWEEIKLPDTSVNLTGLTFNKLTPQFPVRIKLNKRLYWLCECECGNTVVTRADGLRNGHAKSCGCRQKERFQNKRNKARAKMIGRIFGELTIVNLDHTVVFPSGAIRDYYNCKCSCGNMYIVLETSLCSGLTKSCGCKTLEMISKANIKDLTGMRFGKLTTVRPTNTRVDHSVVWECLCDCGETAYIKEQELSNRGTISCGCENSRGEYNIKKILNNHNVPYLHNKGYFKDLLSSIGGLLRYDFIIFSDTNEPIRLVEFDGPQHNEPITRFGGNIHFETTKANDLIKNQYALSHNIPLVRIPYSKRDTITYDDIFGDKYLIKGDI